MGMQCTRCEGTGFLNLHQIPDKEIVDEGGVFTLDDVLKWMETHDSDVQVCDCCGDGIQGWYGVAGEHYNHDDPDGYDGPYGYNGGFAECN